jgi:hypothetical protein
MPLSRPAPAWVHMCGSVSGDGIAQHDHHADIVVPRQAIDGLQGRVLNTEGSP